MYATCLAVLRNRVAHEARTVTGPRQRDTLALHAGDEMTERGVRAEELLQADGGLLFDGYRLDAPPEWRQPIPRDEP